MAIRTILVPTDFSQRASAAFELAIDMAEAYDAQIHLLHVIDSSWSTGAMLYPDLRVPDDLREQVHAAAQSELARVHDSLSSSRIYQRAVLVGRPATCIVNYAKEHEVDMIVMATHGHGALARLLLGSTAEEVVRTATCPVVSVRQEGTPA